jgi:hypothetical protein
MTRSPRRKLLLGALGVAALVAGMPGTSGAAGGYLTPQPPMLTLDASAPAGSEVVAIINSGDVLSNGFLFEGIPDGLGVMPGSAPGTVDAFVNHEQSHVPFPPTLADVADASVSRVTLDTTTGAVLDGSVALPPSAGFIRFCSATMAGPNEGFSNYTFFTNEEDPDIIPVVPGAPYGADPAIAPNREAGYSIVLDPATGDFTQVAGIGRMNHENTMVIPGGWDQIALLTGDDTFFPPFPAWSQLYLYLADNEDAIWNDTGSLWAFQVTSKNGVNVDAMNPFNGANDYGDVATGDELRGRFIRVPLKVARGTLPGVAPQEGLENWSNANNVFQFIRVEDTSYDVNDHHVVYISDTGDRRMVPDPTTGRLKRNPSSGPFGAFPNGRVYKMVFSADNPRKVTSFSILLNGDTGEPAGIGPIHQPDNMGTSATSLMVQEDTSQAPNSRVWRYDFASGTWSVVASVNDPAWESSGIVSVSQWFGAGWWLLDVQAHSIFVHTEPGPPGITLKREGGQLVLMHIPGS